MSTFSAGITMVLIPYLLGSIPFAVMISKRYGISILQAGSGNPGATNVLRSVGKKAGYLVFLLDGLKGTVAAGIPLLLAGPEFRRWEAYGALMACILGHSFSIFLRFKGGKGVATTVGGLLVLVPYILAEGGLVWFITFRLTRTVSLASLCFALSLPLLSWIFYPSVPDTTVLFFIAAFIVGRHHSNIRRLVNRNESSF
ncbi:MAG: glycerol-3-phosphate 1-O-acyltransferase PlsY [Puniceicoccales bacterium]|jgi:glycerol-3-phosphate acyltransferase PlsY|nr:glycerol-3-phosphate 1-O-acyltransferase PlsY [Puniceicoccales bacterium]